MPVYLPELKDATPAGLYAISPIAPNKHVMDFKVGRTTKFEKRLNDYHVCFNEGYYIYCILPLNNNVYAGLGTAEKKREILKLTRTLENAIFKVLKEYMQKRDTRKWKSEWFRLTQAKLAKIFQDIHEKFPDETLPPIVEWDDPHVQFDEEGDQIVSPKQRRRSNRAKKPKEPWEKLDTFKSKQFAY